MKRYFESLEQPQLYPNRLALSCSVGSSMAFAALQAMHFSHGTAAIHVIAVLVARIGANMCQSSCSGKGDQQQYRALHCCQIRHDGSFDRVNAILNGTNGDSTPVSIRVETLLIVTRRCCEGVRAEKNSTGSSTGDVGIEPNVVVRTFLIFSILVPAAEGTTQL